ncbi:MAG: hypothetical protein CVT70_17205 [Alphaproteobacteria bacterium HGW-Alphaproteobacteria-1]|nr:MAG: hypothetical protein CVT70_17205 [Alphaproteobacteria bacterium HGW-Alphaproteobacteria-1]
MKALIPSPCPRVSETEHRRLPSWRPRAAEAPHFKQKNGFHYADPPFFGLIASGTQRDRFSLKHSSPRRLTMKTFAKFEIVGRVGKIKEVGTTLRVSIAAEYGKRDNNGDFQSRPFWNEVTIFNENVIKWAKENVATGDLVRAEGTLRQSDWEGKDGETVYGMTLASDAFDNYSLAIRKQIERGSQDA